MEHWQCRCCPCMVMVPRCMSRNGRAGKAEILACVWLRRQHVSFRPGADAGLRTRRRGDALHFRRGDSGSQGSSQGHSLHRDARQTGARLRPQVSRRLRCQHPPQGSRRQRQPAHRGLPRGPRSKARRCGLLLAALERAHDRRRRRRQRRALRHLRCRRRQVPHRLADARPQRAYLLLQLGQRSLAALEG